MRPIDKMYQLYGIESGKKCGECKHFLRQIYKGKTYFKCGLYGESNSSSTDFRLSYEACGLYNKTRDPKHDRPVKDVRVRKEDDEQIDGQMSLSDFGI